MFASLLPGLREIRAPLAAGYTWLLGLWLAFHDLAVAAGGRAEVFRSEVVQLSEWLGKPAILAAITLGAYIIGTISIAMTHWVDRFVTAGTIGARLPGVARLKPNFRGSIKVTRALKDAAVNKLCNRFLEDEDFREAVLDHVRDCQIGAQREGRRLHDILADYRIDHMRRSAMKDYLYRWHLLETVTQLDPYVEAAKEDLDYIASRLLGREDQLYGEYDRLMTEGTFRLGMVLPLAFAIVALIAKVSVWFAFALPIPVILLYLGSASWTAAERNLAVALAAERVDSPTLARLTTDEIEFTPYHGLTVERSTLASNAVREDRRFQITPATDQPLRPWGAPPPGRPKPK